VSLSQLLSKNRKQFTLYILGASLTTISGLFSTLALSNAFGIIEEVDTIGIRNRILMVALFAFFPILSQVISRYLRIGFMRDILIQVRTLAYQKIMSFSYENFKKEAKENHMSMLVSDINLFEKDFFLSLLNIIYSFGSFILGSLVLWTISASIALATVAVTVLLYIITQWFKPLARKNKELTQQANANYNVELSNTLMGLEVIKLYHVEEYFKQPFASMVEVLEQVKRKAFMVEEFQSNLNHWIASSYQMVIYVYATYLYIQDEINLTALILVFNLIGQLVWSMIGGFNFVNRYQTSVDIFNRITLVQPNVEATQAMSFKEEVKVASLTFSYQDKKVLNQINFVIKPHEKILIVGESGAGKTTLVSCLAQNLSSYEGQIDVDQVELKTIQHEQFLEKVGYIRQQHFLFNDSIKNNILLNQPYDQSKLEQVLKDVDLYDWVMSLPTTFDHVLINDGSNISGGQRQRLSIARELYHDHEVLFVDEPSASLDDVTSQRIYDTLLKLDKTIICVSHRHVEYLKSHFDKTIELHSLRSSA
jgi:ATP-binding cassette, subfamily B, bacterial